MASLLRTFNRLQVSGSLLRTAAPAVGAVCSQSQSLVQQRGLASDHPVWKLGRFNHAAHAVPNLKAASDFYKNMLRARVSEPHDLPSHGVTTVFVDFGNTKIELLHPFGPKSPIANFLKNNPNGGLHHVCIEVDDIEKAAKDLRSRGVRLLSEKPTTGAHGKPVMFVHPKDCHGVLVELEQS